MEVLLMEMQDISILWLIKKEKTWNLELGKAEGKRVILKNNFSNLEALKAQYLCAQIWFKGCDYRVDFLLPISYN